MGDAATTDTPPRAQGLLGRRPAAAQALGLLAVVSSLLYLVSDVIEARQGGFSDLQLGLTLAGEAAVPVVVLGLAAWQHPALERFGWVGAGAYAYAYAVFAGTVVYALADDTSDDDTLADELGLVMTVHGVVMVVAGLAFGLAVLRARLLPAWAAGALMIGVVLVAATQGAGDPLVLVAAATRDAGLAGMGAALLAGRADGHRREPPSPARRGDENAPPGPGAAAERGEPGRHAGYARNLEADPQRPAGGRSGPGLGRRARAGAPARARPPALTDQAEAVRKRYSPMVALRKVARSRKAVTLASIRSTFRWTTAGSPPPL